MPTSTVTCNIPQAIELLKLLIFLHCANFFNNNNWIWTLKSVARFGLASQNLVTLFSLLLKLSWLILDYMSYFLISARFLPPLDSRQQSRLNVLMDGFTTYIHLALKPISVSPFSVPDSKKALREKTRPKSLNLLSPFRYFLPDMSSLAIADKPIS